MPDATDQRTEHAVSRLAALLESSGRSIGVAESLTGGLLVQALARHQGSSAWLAGGVVAYQRSVKHDLLEVQASKVVSSAAAGQMASAVRRRLGCDVGVAVTGVGGPDRQDGEPPGTVWMAVDAGEGPTTQLLTVDTEPEQIVRLATVEAIVLAIGQLESAASQGLPGARAG